MIASLHGSFMMVKLSFSEQGPVIPIYSFQGHKGKKDETCVWCWVSSVPDICALLFTHPVLFNFHNSCEVNTIILKYKLQNTYYKC